MQRDSGLRQRLYWVGIAALLFLAAGVATIRELGAGNTRGKDQVERFDLVSRGVVPDPLSLKGTQTNLIDCLEMADGLYARLQTADQRQKITAPCSHIAADALASFPTYGLGALVSARMAAMEEDWASFNAMIRQSQAGSRAEQWISVQRLRLYVKFADYLEPETHAARTEDIQLLLMSPVGIRSIATVYLENQSLRHLIAAEAENLPEDKKLRFLSELRAALRSRAGA